MAPRDTCPPSTPHVSVDELVEVIMPCDLVSYPGSCDNETRCLWSASTDIIVKTTDPSLVDHDVITNGVSIGAEGVETSIRMPVDAPCGQKTVIEVHFKDGEGVTQRTATLIFACGGNPC